MPAAWVAIAGSVIGAASQNDAANKASGAQTSSSKEALAQQQAQYNQTRSDTAQYREAGSAAVNDLGTYLGVERSGIAAYGSDPRYKAIYDKLYSEADALHRAQQSGRPLSAAQTIDPNNYAEAIKGLQARAAQQFESQYPDAARSNSADPRFGALNKKFTIDDFWSDPVTQSGYKSGLDLGEKGIRNIASAGGMRNSGQTLKALTQFGTDYTGGKANDAYARFYSDQDRIFNRLSGVAGTGQTATLNTANLGQQSASNIGGLLTAQGNARGAASIAQGNAWGNAATNVGNWYNSNQQLDKYLASRNGTTKTASSNDLNYINE